MEMTLEKAHEMGLDVMTVTLAQEEPFTVAMKSVGREVFAFNHELPTISGQKVVLRMVALGKRPGSGSIAQQMNQRAKEKMTVRQFIQQEEDAA